jgi:hypothetical protein
MTAVTLPAVATFKRYVDDPTTTETELQKRKGQRVTVAPADFYYDDEIGTMYSIMFEDGYTDQAFAEELSEWVTLS